MKRFGALVAIVASLALAACGQGENGAASSTPVGGASGRELADVQVLHIGNGAEIQTLDPHRGEEVQGSNVQRDVFEGLVNEAPNGDLIPGAAESWTVSDDGKTYVFVLRRTARWSNGDPVTAHDFVYGLRRAGDPATLSVYTYILSPILNADDIAAGRRPPTDLGVRALDDYTLEITLANATPYFLGLLTHSMAYPLHRASVEEHGDQFTRPGNLVGNGAYMLDEWVVQSHIKLVRNPHYWDNAKTIIDEVWFYPTENQNAELQRFRANELDITDIIPTAQLGWIRENLADQLIIAPYLGSYYYGFNVTRPPFKDNLNLRRALSLAVNREIITEQILGAGQIPAFGWVPPVMHYTGQQMPEAAWTQAEREAEAKRLYAEAGYSAENPLRTEIMYNTQEDHRRIAVAISSMWKQVLGVETSILNQEWKVFIDTRNQKKDTQVYRQGWIGDYNDAFTFADLMRSTTGQNDTGYSNPEYDRLVGASQQELDLDKRAALLEAAERVMLEDMPILPLYFYVKARMIKPSVGGYQSNIMDHHLHKNFYILKH
ncbi:MAG TPA: peptide ABC transporter substrate-binding protein [Gammaproteobacteria bacterium]|nr:peptide ABC transporter substrate-binding protein [Gammaproteobacteria bacterium]